MLADKWKDTGFEKKRRREKKKRSYLSDLVTSVML